MVFAIGWSSVSVASTKSMHLDMMQVAHEQMSLHCQKMQADNATAPMHAVKMAQNEPMPLTHCLSAADTAQMAHEHCSDCSAMACQSSVFAVIVQPFALSVPAISYKNKRIFSHYQVQYLLGHRQKILRPPKA